MSIKLIVGLLNPGSEYAQTRHNAGGWFVEMLAQQHNALFKIDKKLHSNITQLDFDNKTSCKIVLPTGYMNHSGQSVREVCQFYRIEANEIVVAHDELDLPVGRIKLKTGGGHGGHNGLRDIINQLGTNDFHRLRIGIGHPGHKDLVLNYVLGKPSLLDKQQILDAIDRGVALMPTILSGPIAIAMSQLNQ